MKQTFRIFVINLPKDKERKEIIEKRLKDLGVRYEIFNGIYGDDERSTSRYNEKLAIRDHGKALMTGEKGAAMSHALIYEKVVKENIPYALILEDDIILPDYFMEVVQGEIDSEDKNWDWLSFDYRYVGLTYLRFWIKATLKMIKRRPLFFFKAILKFPYVFFISIYEAIRNSLAKRYPSQRGPKNFYRPLYNAGAYLISTKGAKKAGVFTKPLRISADRMPNIAKRKSDFIFKGYAPLIVQQSMEFESNTMRSNNDWKKVQK